MNKECCVFDIRTNRYFFHCDEKLVDDYLSVHKENCRQDNKPVWLIKKFRQVGEWK